MVKDFYANLFFSQNPRILKSFVQGKEITLDDSTLGRILNIPNEGWGIQNLSDWSLYPISPLEQTRIVMSDDSFQSKCVPHVDKLPPFSRIIHHLCFYNIFPRDPELLQVSEQDMFFISSLLSKKPINLPGSILSFMAFVVEKDLSLPYGGILTHVFEYFGVNLDGNEYIFRQPFPNSILDQLIISAFENEHCRKSKGKQPLVVDEVIEVQDMPQIPTIGSVELNPPQFQQPGQSSTSHSLEDLYSLIQYINSRVITIEQYLLFLQEQQAQTNQILTDLMNVLAKLLSSSS